MTKYLHTIDDEPATYHKGSQICFVGSWQYIKLANSLKQIRAEQRASREWRRAGGFSADTFKFGYRLVKL